MNIVEAHPKIVGSISSTSTHTPKYRIALVPCANVNYIDNCIVNGLLKIKNTTLNPWSSDASAGIRLLILV